MSKILTAVGGTPWVTRTVIANQMGISTRTVDERVRELKKSGRYGEHVVIKDGGLTLINYLAFIDFLEKRERIKNGIQVEEFNPKEQAKAIGWY